MGDGKMAQGRGSLFRANRAVFCMEWLAANKNAVEKRLLYFTTLFKFCNICFLLRSVLLEETNTTNNKAPGQDTRWAPHSGRERSTRGTGTETGVGGGVGSGVLAWQRAGQVCYLGRGATGPADVGN
jgi:hypothetical protein